MMMVAMTELLGLANESVRLPSYGVRWPHAAGRLLCWPQLGYLHFVAGLVGGALAAPPTEPTDRMQVDPRQEGFGLFDPPAIKVASSGNTCPCGSITTDPHSDIPACVGCARCCHLLVELKTDVDFVPEKFVVTYNGARFMDQRGDGACAALDLVSRLCTIYEERPWVCRQFDRGGTLCRKILFGPEALRAHTAGAMTTNKQ